MSGKKETACLQCETSLQYNICILMITWQQRIQDIVFLQNSGIVITIRKQRLRRLGHVRRMPDGQLSKEIMYEKWIKVEGRPASQDCALKAPANVI